jgi:hypothetical protein
LAGAAPRAIFQLLRCGANGMRQSSCPLSRPYNFQALRFRILGLLLLSVILAVSALAADPPKRVEGAQPGDCAACHGQTLVLPKSHVPTAAMEASGCLECHEKSSPLSLVARIPLGHWHQLSGVTCVMCHPPTGPPGPLSTEQCLTCHGSLEQVAARTAATRPNNPHASPHGKTYMSCDLCHYQHARSENFCTLCHAFEYTVP